MVSYIVWSVDPVENGFMPGVRRASCSDDSLSWCYVNKQLASSLEGDKRRSCKCVVLQALSPGMLPLPTSCASFVLSRSHDSAASSPRLDYTGSQAGDYNFSNQKAIDRDLMPS